jgi:hypothetical protein
MGILFCLYSKALGNIRPLEQVTKGHKAYTERNLISLMKIFYCFPSSLMSGRVSLKRSDPINYRKRKKTKYWLPSFAQRSLDQN